MNPVEALNPQSDFLIISRCLLSHSFPPSSSTCLTPSFPSVSLLLSVILLLLSLCLLHFCFILLFFCSSPPSLTNFLFHHQLYFSLNSLFPSPPPPPPPVSLVLSFSDQIIFIVWVLSLSSLSSVFVMEDKIIRNHFPAYHQSKLSKCSWCCIFNVLSAGFNTPPSLSLSLQVGSTPQVSSQLTVWAVSLWWTQTVSTWCRTTLCCSTSNFAAATTTDGERSHPSSAWWVLPPPPSTRSVCAGVEHEDMGSNY